MLYKKNCSFYQHVSQHMLCSKPSRKLIVAGLIFVLSLLKQAPNASASYFEVAAEKYDKALQLYKERDATKTSSMNEAYNILTEIDQESLSKDVQKEKSLRYDVLILMSRISYWMGSHNAFNVEKVKYFDAGAKVAIKAQELNKYFAEGFYYAGLNTARWAEASGYVAALEKKKEIMDLFETSRCKYLKNRVRNESPVDIGSGERIDGYGPHRALGYAYLKVPREFGGSPLTGERYLKVSYERAPDYIVNHVFYAECLITRGKKTEGCTILKNLIDKEKGNDLASFDQERRAENIEELKLAKDIYDVEDCS